MIERRVEGGIAQSSLGLPQVHSHRDVHVQAAEIKEQQEEILKRN